MGTEKHLRCGLIEPETMFCLFFLCLAMKTLKYADTVKDLYGTHLYLHMHFRSR